MVLLTPIELAHQVVIVFCSLFIFLRTGKIYELTGHKGVRAFRNTFFFFAIAFIVQFFLDLLSDMNAHTIVLITLLVAFDYLLVMAVFSLVYSLVWKEVEANKLYFMHGLSLLIATFATIFGQFVMYVTMLITIAYAATVSFANYKSGQHNFLQLYFIALVLAFVGFAGNFTAYYIFPTDPSYVMYAYALDAAVFLIFLYGIVKTIKWPKKERD